MGPQGCGYGGSPAPAGMRPRRGVDPPQGPGSPGPAGMRPGRKRLTWSVSGFSRASGESPDSGVEPSSSTWFLRAPAILLSLPLVLEVGALRRALRLRPLALSVPKHPGPRRGRGPGRRPAGRRRNLGAGRRATGIPLLGTRSRSSRSGCSTTPSRGCEAPRPGPGSRSGSGWGDGGGRIVARLGGVGSLSPG